MVCQKNNNNNQSSGTANNRIMHQHLRFEDADEVIEDAAESSNLDESMCDPNADAKEPAISFIDADDKTSADYYFDSYSHFGNFFLALLLCC